MNEGSSLIPDDPLTRKLLARVLAELIRSDFEKARSAAGEQPNQQAQTAAADDCPMGRMKREDNPNDRKDQPRRCERRGRR